MNKIKMILGMVMLVINLWIWQPVEAANTQIPYTIQFYKEGAGEVVLVWGVNGWNTTPTESWPEGTYIKKKVLYTPMMQMDGYFETTLYVDEGATLQFGFLTTADVNDTAVSIWDTDNEESYDVTVEQPEIVRFSAEPVYQHIPSH